METTGVSTISTGQDVAGTVSAADIADDLGAGLARLAVHAAAATPVQRVVLFDPESMSDLRPGDVVLGIGVAAQGAGLEQLHHLIDAAVAGGAALVILRQGVYAVVAQRASLAERELSVLEIDRGIAWEQVYSLVQASIGSRSLQYGSQSSGNGVPLGNMFELATAMSNTVQAPVILEDAFFHVVGYSSDRGESDPGRRLAILSRHVPPDWLSYLRDTGVLERLRRTDDVCRLDTGPMDAKPRLITSVKYNGELIGVIWVAEGSSPLTEQMEQSLRELRLAAVPHFQRYLTAERPGNIRRRELLRRLIQCSGNAQIIGRELGLTRERPYSLVAAGPERSDGAQWLNRPRLELFQALLQQYHSAAVETTHEHVAYGLVPVDTAEDRARLARTLSRFATEAVFGGEGSVVAISTPRPIDGFLGAVAEELRLMRNLPRGRDPSRLILGWDAEALVMVRRAELLLSLDARFTFSKMAALEEHDRREGTAFVETVADYLRRGLRTAHSSRSLHLHHTTVRYRLRRMREIADLRLDDPAELLAAHLHLLARRSFTESVPPTPPLNPT
jgi:DNA-binding PucR family transcriptional regulator